MKNLIDLKFLSPDDASGTSTEEELIVETDQVTEEEPDDEDEDESDEEDEEEDEEEDKENEKDDEEDLARASFSDIKEKYPQFFKDFPSLKHAFFREQQFSEVFPTIEDAKKAAEAQQQLADMSEAVMDGDVDRFLTEIKSEDPNSLERFANNFLPALENVSKELYFNVLGPKIQTYVKSVFDHGNEKKDDNIKNAAKIVHKILFGGDYNDIERVTAGKIGTNGKKEEGDLDKDKKEFFAKKYQTLYSDVTNTCYSKLDEEIGKGLSDLSKEKGLQRILITDIKNKVLSEMEKDSTYLSRMQGLWKREQRSGFSGTLKDSFMVTFMAKAKTLIPKIRAEARKEVLGKDRNKDNGKGATRITAGKQGSSKGKPMTLDRVKTEKLTSRQVFDD